MEKKTKRMPDKKKRLRELQRLPGVGPKVADDLLRLGVKKVDDLIGRDPEELYERLCKLEQTRVDRCMLYVFRCAVYAASTPRPNPRLLKWWAWKDGRKTARR